MQKRILFVAAATFSVATLLLGTRVALRTDLVGSLSLCSPLERQWGEWCVYTGGDDTPDRIIHGFDNVYHPSAWFRNGKWKMLLGGWADPPSNQGWHDQVYLLDTSDPYGISGWRIVPDPSGSLAAINNTFDNAGSSDMPLDVTTDRDGKPVVPHRSFHSVQPDVVPFETYPKKPDGGAQTCCDAVYYSYDYEGRFPERHVGIHMAFIDSLGSLQRAGQYGDKNPALNWHSYAGLGGDGVVGTSDGRVVFDPKTGKFYMVYAEWWDTKRGPYDDAATTSLAVADWTNARFRVLKRNLFDMDVFAGNPQIVVGPNGKYYAFYTRFGGGLFVAEADDITGPYRQHRNIMMGSSSLPIVGTPFVFCNSTINQWQMYFSASDSGAKNQVYTAFSHRSCSESPVPTAPPASSLPTVVPSTTPFVSPSPLPTPTSTPTPTPTPWLTPVPTPVPTNTPTPAPQCKPMGSRCVSNADCCSLICGLKVGQLIKTCR